MRNLIEKISEIKTREATSLIRKKIQYHLRWYLEDSTVWIIYRTRIPEIQDTIKEALY